MGTAAQDHRDGRGDGSGCRKAPARHTPDTQIGHRRYGTPPHTPDAATAPRARPIPTTAMSCYNADLSGWEIRREARVNGNMQDILALVTGRIVPRFRPHRIILFGSHAHGQPGVDSDLDFLIIMEVDGSTRRMANEIDMVMSDRLIPMDFIVLTPEQYERQKKMPGTIVREVEETGTVLYDHAA